MIETQNTHKMNWANNSTTRELKTETSYKMSSTNILHQSTPKKNSAEADDDIDCSFIENKFKLKLLKNYGLSLILLISIFGFRFNE